MSEPPEQQPTLEEAARIDPAALEHWFKIPADAGIILHASRVDLDALFIGLRDLTFAQGNGLAALQLWVNGDAESAQTQFAQALQKHVDALKNITRFTSGVMAKAQVDE